MSTHTASYQELLARRTALEQQIAAAHEAERADALQKIQALIETFGLTQEDVFPPEKPKRRASSPVAPKYRDPATGLTWTGRGKPPVWIRDQDRSLFAI